MSTICIDQRLFYSSIIILVILTIYFTHFRSFNECKIEKEKQKEKREEKKEIIPISNILIDRDYNALNDPLSPNERRVDRSWYPRSPLLQSINIPTRGYPDNYQYMGNLFRQSDEKVIKLMGRETYPGSWRFEYYGLAADPSGMDFKVNIEKRDNREIRDGDELSIPFFDVGKGRFKAIMNKYDTPRYNPYVYP